MYTGVNLLHKLHIEILKDVNIDGNSIVSDRQLRIP